ncbi:histidine kinase N-terminal 7TM domain-containing protein [Paenibacillus sp. FSL R5-0407]|uniref:histidine kinase N-terminal 7TM domain-containing diguanylate cyclase n=1 Tax=Paenibacillus sp. FSL R5-0407 TaxID=2975320 RepID=UPI0030FCC3E4
MNSPISIFIVLAALSGVLSVLLAIYAFVNRNKYSGINLFFWITGLSAIYAFGFAFELTGNTLKEIMFWANVEYVGMPFIAPLSLMLVMYYVGLEKFITGRKLVLMLIIPAITLVMITTNEWHHLFYRDIYLNPNAPRPMMDIVMGEWYVVHGSYTVGCLLVGTFLLLRYWNRRKNVLRRQVAALLIGFVLPGFASFLYLMKLTPYEMDLVPIIMCVTSFFYIWAIRTSGLMIVAPVAREYIFDSMRDGVLVVDPAGLLADFNPAAAMMIPGLSSANIGKPVSELRLSENFNEPVFDFHSDHNVTDEKEISWSIGQETCYYHIHSSPVINRRGRFVGKTITVMDVTERARMEEKLTMLASYDGLTGIFNRTFFMETARGKLAAAENAKESFSLIVFDIDFFKHINDRFGHGVGDQALRHIAALGERYLMAGGLLGRYGGEEFVIGLPGIDLPEAAAAAEKLRREIENTPLNSAEGPIRITASFGVAEFGLSGQSLEELFMEADRALYRSKENGRNRVSTAKDDLVLQR